MTSIWENPSTWQFGITSSKTKGGRKRKPQPRKRRTPPPTSDPDNSDDERSLTAQASSRSDKAPLVKKVKSTHQNTGVTLVRDKRVQTKANHDNVFEDTPEPRRSMNATQQAFPKGELEYDRTKWVRRITWLVHFADDQVNDNYIFFYAHEEAYGRPFGFMTNFADGKFKYPTVREDHVFVSIEQCYQYAKTFLQRTSQEEIDGECAMIPLMEPPLSSDHLPYLILEETDPSAIARFGRAPCSLKEDDPDWCRLASKQPGFN